MGRPATGSVRFRSGRWWVRLTVDGRDKLVPIDPPLTKKTDKPRALREAREMAKLVRGPSPSTETAREWSKRWLDHKRDKGQSSVDAPKSHLENYILPVIGDVAMASVSKRDLERIVQNLDAKICAGEIRWKYALNIWGTVTKAFDDAHRAKVLDLRVRDDNPARDVRGPDRGVATEKVHLFPGEFLDLADSSVPLFRRRYYTIAIYCYLRPAELEALRWEDIDLARETIQIRRGINRSTSAEKAPKAGRARATFDIEPELMPLLRAMQAEAEGQEYVVGRLGDERELAEQLRRDLLDAGVLRVELHQGSDDPPREWMTMHDCRTTGITWMAVEGKRQPFEIMARAGHRTLEQTQAYIDRASLIRRNYGKPFPPLPESLLSSEPELAEEFPDTFTDNDEDPSAFVAEAHGNRTLSRGRSREPRAVSRTTDRDRSRPRRRLEVLARDLGEPPCPDTRPEMNPARRELLYRLAEACKRALARDDVDAAERIALEILRHLGRSDIAGPRANGGPRSRAGAASA